MAKNLQSKLRCTDKISIFDINAEAMKRLESDMRAASEGAEVELAPSAWAASKDAVSFGGGGSSEPSFGTLGGNYYFLFTVTVTVTVGVRGAAQLNLELGTDW